MRVVIQRVSEASVNVADENYSASIESGFLVLLGIEESDEDVDIDWLVRKLINLRVFSDNEGRMNLSIQDITGEMLIISQFTLHASTKKGNRPSFIKAAKPEIAIPLYEQFIQKIQGHNIGVQSGIFGADMKVHLVNDGPVTIIIDSKQKE